jgi:hypothetical protein
VVPLNRVFDSLHMCRGVVDGVGERLCHVPRVGSNRPVFNPLLTRSANHFNMGLNARGAHSYRTQSASTQTTTERAGHRDSYLAGRP